MGYQPTLEDIPQSTGYQPTVEDIPYMIEGVKSEQYKPQIQEEFSNPSQMTGFENLSPQEQKSRIAWSATDPANQTSLGGFVPPGSYESAPVRMAASTLPTLAAPQLRAGFPLIRGALNALSRIGAGTAGNIAYESPNINNIEDLKNIAQNSAQMNAIMELPFMGLRALRGGAEIYNPSHRYAAQKANEIRNEAVAARALQRETYAPVFNKYGNSPVTSDVANFVANTGIERNRLYPEAKQLYDEFVTNPTFQNLHNLQSKIGGDIRKVTMARNKPLTEQRFTQYRNALNNEAQTFLSRDQNALAQYNLGSQITRNLVEPFNANQIVKQLSRGTRIHATPQEIAGAIKRGREKIVHERSGNVFTAIPEGHPLERHFNEINNRLSIGEGLQELIPKHIKGFFPGVRTIQNQRLNNLFETANPFAYLAGRAGIAQSNE